MQLTPDGKRNITNPHNNKSDGQTNENNANVPLPVSSVAPKATEEDFFEMLTRTQSKRMDDQRCSIPVSLKVIGHTQSQTSREPPIRKPLVQQNSLPALPSTPPTQTTKENRNALLEMIADLQSERMDEQRAQLPGLVPSPQNQSTRRNLMMNTQSTSRNASGGGGAGGEPAPDDAFLDMLMRCQGSRLEEQRSELPRTNVTLDMEQGEPPNNNRRNCVNNNTNNAGATVPDEDFFSLIMRVQGGRMEDQRAAVSTSNQQN